MNDAQALAITQWIQGSPSPASGSYNQRVNFDRERDRKTRESESEQKLHRPSRAGKLRRWLKRFGWLVGISLIVLVLLQSARSIVSAFHLVEKLVHRDSLWHMTLAFLVTLPFSLGIPIPLVHQAWAVAIGCFFRWNAFPILFAALAVGVPLPFLIGRRLSGGGDAATVETRLRSVAPSAVAYLSPLRKAISTRPIRSSFLLMWGNGGRIPPCM